ncbi:MAG: hypothetical protein SFV55_29935 [Haliscomenobacter sp.]|uniref:hypothetical protein n=1 Tax=Haliscomenobacter sp. TaxID=2717303 RepID=UPI0029B278E7|nr:hypothetical protein [Haliscomenobacter sp.]MDX2072693.1 hypothetical protein [Haliscomenobacter sp.]
MASQIFYANFLEDRRVYGLAKTYWKRFFDQLAAANGFSYRPYINDANDYDGNPIFSAYIPDKNRAVRVIQIDPNELEDNTLTTAWMDTIELVEGQAAIDELVIYTVLTVETRVKCVALIEEWVLGEVTVEEMKRRIEEVWRD